ncbi:MAG TPA: SIMPL domain-containing protein [Bryobacteraceae bacterium]|nr:SIMPL domain-containing protein [Bryobacteraceae bacterium]
MRSGLTTVLLLTAAALFCERAARAQEPHPAGPRPSSIRTLGEATVSAKPDHATLDIGVVTQAANAEAAGSQNATQVSAVVSRLKSLGPAAEIKTVNYAISPNYRYPKEGGQPSIAGYTASNTVQFSTGDLRLVAKAIDLATQSGANNIQRLQFQLKNAQAVRDQALREAATQARKDADALASALGLKIVRVLSVEETSSGRPQPMRAMAAMAKEATPIESGTIDVSASITLTVQVE